MLPLTDSRGETLHELRLHHPQGDLPRPAALIVVCRSGEVLLGLDRRRQRWEIFGGRIEPGESEEQAAARELAEESGIRDVTLVAAAVAEFRLSNPTRQEEAAVFRADPGPAALVGHRVMVPNTEIANFIWWRPETPPPQPVSELDAAIADWVTKQASSSK